MVGKGFIHTPVIIESIYKGNTGYVTQGLLHVRQGNGGGYDKYIYFADNFNFIIEKYRGDCPKTSALTCL